jgi:hypothetical protein
MLICLSWCLYTQPSTQNQQFREKPTAAWEIHVRVYLILTFPLIKFPSKLRGPSRPVFITNAYTCFAKSRGICFIVNSFSNLICFTMYLSTKYESSYRFIIFMSHSLIYSTKIKQSFFCVLLGNQFLYTYLFIKSLQRFMPLRSSHRD